ncbi:hypothetical protein CPB86DRAFT_824176 [Serendipita vermifera]|nr:hypothetical protein CPB86DRAFT_824176 [Serendipita vermifera]
MTTFQQKLESFTRLMRAGPHLWKKVKAIISAIATLDEVEAPIFDEELEAIIEPIAGMLCDLGSDPDNFDPDQYPGILSSVTEEEINEDIQRYYLRLYQRPRGQAIGELERYLLYQAVDASWACHRLAQHGEHERATALLNLLMEKCSFEGAAFMVEGLDPCRESDFITDIYVGTTRRSPLTRVREDEKAQESRFTNFMSMAHPSDIKVYEIVPLRRPLDDPLDFRRVPLLADLEQVLVACTRPSLNSHIGGFAPRYRPTPSLLAKCQRAASFLPTTKVVGNTNLDLNNKVHKMFEEEKDFFEWMRAEGHDVGVPISPQAFEAVKRSLIEQLSLIGGAFSTLSLLKDITREEFTNAITPGFFSPDKGYAMAFHWHLLGLVLAMDGEDTSTNYERLLPPYVDILRLSVSRKCWGINSLMTSRLLRELNPFFVITYGAVASYWLLLDKANHLAKAVGLGDHLDESWAENPQVKSYKPPGFNNRMFTIIGELLLARTGSDDDQVVLMLGNLDPGTGRYQPSLLDIRMKIEFLVTFKAHVTRRLLEAHLNDPTFTQPGRRKAGLEGIKKKVEELLTWCGVEQEIERSRIHLQNMETAEGKLKGKHVVAGELIHAPRKKRNHRISLGVVALGPKNSPEREKQLQELRADAQSMKSTDTILTILGPGNCDPSTEMYAEWLMNMEAGTSLYLSANRMGRSLESMQTAASYDQRLALWNKKEALEYRIAQAQKYGSHPKAVLWERFPIAAEMLSNGVVNNTNGKTLDFSSSIFVGPCGGCGEVDIRLTGNTEHRCNVDDKPVMITNRRKKASANEDDDKKVKGKRAKKPRKKNPQEVFEGLMPLSLNDLVRALDGHVTDENFAAFGFYEEEAIGHLLDSAGHPLGILPPGLDPHILENTTIWRKDSTPDHVLVFSALDEALRLHAQQNGNLIGDIASLKACELWNVQADGKVIDIYTEEAQVEWVEHKACGYISVWSPSYEDWKRRQSHRACPKLPPNCDIPKIEQYNEGSAHTFLELPYVLMRAYAYKALVEKDDRFVQMLQWQCRISVRVSVLS